MEQVYKAKAVKVVEKVSKNGNPYSVFVVVLDNGCEATLGFANYKELLNIDYASRKKVENND